jgi:predicted N-formylglutamate amidohydrolase
MSLLEADEAPSVELLRPDGTSPLVLVCDHASNAIPRKLGSLGLDARALASHVAWDIGAAAVARRLSERLDAPLVLAGYSRLVIDCNRPLDSPQSIPERSADVDVPGNRGLGEAERRERIDACFWPYQRAVANLLDARGERTRVLLAIHSFTPVLAVTGDGSLPPQPARPWPIAVAHEAARADTRLAAPLLAALRAEPACMPVGDNEPYAIGRSHDYTVPVHGCDRGLPCAMIEMRQDGLQTPTGIEIWADRLCTAIEQALRTLGC